MRIWPWILGLGLAAATAAVVYGSDEKMYRLTSPEGTWVFRESVLNDTLYESELWFSRRADVERLQRGETVQSGGELLERIY